MDSLRLFASVFAVVFVAELPDKTAFATLLLATRNRPLGVFAGAAVAFAVQSAVGVALGNVLGLLPPRVVALGTAALFFLFAFLMWRRRDEAETDATAAGQQSFLKAAMASFLVIFAAEWGDLTQMATAALAARTHAPFTVFAASTAALWSVTGLAVVAGHRLKHVVDPTKLKKVAALAFVLVGAVILVKALS